MAGDDLHEPLGMGPPTRGSSRRRTTTVAIAAVGLAVVGGLGALLISASPHGGEPFAVATIPPPKPPADRTPTASIRAMADPGAIAAQTPDDGGDKGVVENGVTVFRSNRSTPHPGGPLIIKVPEALGMSDIAAVDKRLVEQSRYGPLPKIAADGARPRDVYARPSVFGQALPPGAPRIALYIGGLGISQAATTAAIEHMPAAVSLAFAPYGQNLDDAVKRAKAAGHEVLLQLPMEAFGDAQSQPGPHTLGVDAGQATTIDDLHWLMSRMSGYVGVTNFLGGRFTADSAAMTTMLQEIGGRGLLYVEDGTSKRSVSATLAPTLGVPAARADVVLDAGDPATLRAGLVKLEATARDKGSAIGMASDLPDNLGAIAQFAETLAAKGIALVPVSALASTSAPMTAAAP